MAIAHSLLIDSRAERRESNIELLRIVAMSMILCYHFIFNGGPREVSGYFRLSDSLFIYGTNIFILISGWFSIRTTWRSLLHLYLYTLFIIVVSISAYTLFTGTLPNSWHMIGNTVFAPLSGSTLWFIGVYYALMLVAPLINRGVRGISIHNWRVLIIALSFLEFYGIYLFNNPVDKFGNTLYNFIYLYCLGRYLRLEPKIRQLSTRTLFLSFGVIFLIYLFLQYFFLSYDGSTHYDDFFHYASRRNAPTRIINSAILLLLFSRWHFHSKIINYIASASLGCYIIQDGFVRNFWYGMLRDIVNIDPTPIHWLLPWTLTAFGLYLFYWVASCLLTTVSRLFIPAMSARIEQALPSWMKPERNYSAEEN